MAASTSVLHNVFRMSSPCHDCSIDPLALSQVDHPSERSALHKAAFWGHKELVRWLSHDLKLDPNAQDFYGDTAMHDAARFGHTSIVETLLAARASVCVRNNRGQTPLNIAEAHGKEDIALLLRGAGAALCSL